MAAYGKRIPDGSFTAMSLKLATSCPDPFRPVGFLLSSHSAKGSLFELGGYKAAAGSFTLPATTCRWLLHLDCSRSSELNGRYPATKSTAEISVPGQKRTVAIFELKGRHHR